jgi:hypothetical protein
MCALASLLITPPIAAVTVSMTNEIHSTSAAAMTRDEGVEVRTRAIVHTMRQLIHGSALPSNSRQVSVNADEFGG